MVRRRSKAKKLLLARHCETGPDYFGRFVGSSDIGLGPMAPEQAARLAETIEAYGPEAVYCSPLKRARRTVELVEEHTELPEVVVDSDLKEIDFGRWEGLSFGEIAIRDTELVNRWALWDPDFAFPEGEAVSDFLQRVQKVADRLASLDEKTILVVAHGGVVRAMLCHYLRLPPEHYLLFDIKPAQLTVIDVFQEGGVLTGLNL
jgi:alpha-ribazole phosphatase